MKQKELNNLNHSQAKWALGIDVQSFFWYIKRKFLKETRPVGDEIIL